MDRELQQLVLSQIIPLVRTTLKETAELTGMLIGGVTPLALREDLPVWVDAAFMERESIVLGGGSRSMKLRVEPEVFRRLPAVEIVPDLATPFVGD